jgi:hypothetical protein
MCDSWGCRCGWVAQLQQSQSIPPGWFYDNLHAIFYLHDSQLSCNNAKSDLPMCYVDIGSNWGFFRLVGYYFNSKKHILVLIFQFQFQGCHTWHVASNGRNIIRLGVCTRSYVHLTMNVNFITITKVLPLNWYKTERLFHMDNSSYVLFRVRIYNFLKKS